MLEDLKNSMNLSNEYFSYGTKIIPDPIDIKITNREVNESNKIADRFLLKDRVINQRESLGSFRIPVSELKKHTNPSDEYQRKLELELQKKKQLLLEYEKKNIPSDQLYSYSQPPNKTNFDNVLYSEKDIENMLLDGNASANENLIKMLEAQVKLLKAQTEKQKKNLNKMTNDKYSFSGSHVIEPKVSTHFFAANDDRVQAVKHVQTQQKPEYMSLEELQRQKRLHEKHLLEVENEYYGRKVETEEEKELKRQMKLKAIQAKKEMNMIHRPGYNNDEPLDDYDKKYVDKFGRFLERKSRLPDKIGYEEEWNTTKVKSQNANGIVNRNDGLPGYLDQDDYELYYYDIDGKDHNLNFQRPLKSHPHTGRENTLKRTFRNEPGYESTMNKFVNSSTGFHPWMSRMNNTMPNMNTNNLGGSINVNNFNFTNTGNNNFNNGDENVNNDNNNIDVNDNGNVENNVNNGNNDNPPFTFKDDNQNNDIVKINQSIQMKSSNVPLRQSTQLNPSSQQLSFIKMIFGMLNKNNDNEAPKNTIPNDMKLDDDMIHELGFNDKNDFNDKLQNYPTKKPNLMNEEEFTNFLLNKGENIQNGNIQPQKYEEEKNSQSQNFNNNSNNNFTNTMNNDIVNTNTINQNFNKNVQNSIPQKLYNSSPFPELFADKEDEELPGLSTNTMDFLKDPSTKHRLKELKKTLKHSNSQNPKNFKLNKSLDMKQKPIYDLQRNNSESHLNQAHNENYYPTQYSQNFPKKSDINFTIPQPFNFLKKNYHEKKLLKMQEILEDRQKKEDKVFKHTFHANPLNKRMFNKEGDLSNIIEREKAARKKRTDKLKEEIQKNMKPFDFYDEDERKYKERIHQECMPPQFPQFKANPIRYKSQVNMYEGIIGESREKRDERIQKRALETLNNAKLPPRMEMHEKQKKLQEQEKKIYEAKKEEEEKKMRKFKSNKVPNFVKEQEEFLSKLDRMKKAAKPTVPEPFNFVYNPKKKADIYNFLDNENNPYVKNPITKKEKKKKEEERRKMMQMKPEIEPATTKALSLLMETRRKELEKKKKEEERIKKEDMEREKRQNRLNERVRTSKAIVDNTEALKKKREENKEIFIKKLNDERDNYRNNLAIINQRVANRPLMLESIGKDSLQRVIDDQTQNEINDAINEAKIKEEEMIPA